MVRLTLVLLTAAHEIPPRVESPEVQILLHKEESYAYKNPERAFCDAAH